MTRQLAVVDHVEKLMHYWMKNIFIAVFVLYSTGAALAQCDAIVPSIDVDFSSNPDTSWVSAPIARQGHCCAATAGDRCVVFNITTHSDVKEILFEIETGTTPGNSEYQIDCGPIEDVGDRYCVKGGSTHSITYCRPGGSTNTFRISTVAKPRLIIDSILVTRGCEVELETGTYRGDAFLGSISPGAELQYNSLIGCNASICLASPPPIFTATPTAPSQINYLICQASLADLCQAGVTCDTIQVHIADSLKITLSADQQLLCSTQPNTTLRSLISGGVPPYTYAWNNGGDSDTTEATSGIYSLTVTDATGCSKISEEITITQSPPPVVEAGLSQTICAGSTVILNGTPSGGSLVYWSGGTGIFSPDSSVTTATYTPSSADILAGSIQLYLNVESSCPFVRDSIEIIFRSFDAPITFSSSDISCFGANNGEAEAIVTGPNSPYSFNWDGTGTASASTIDSLLPGNHNLIIADNNGCDTILVFTILEPDKLNLGITNVSNVSCFGLTDGTAEATVSGGTTPLNFLWSTGETNLTEVNLSEGNHSFQVEDDLGCIDSVTVSITQPTELGINLVNKQDISCSGVEDGEIEIAATGGTPNYSYNWTPSATGTQLGSLSAGDYQIAVTDGQNCSIDTTITIVDPGSIQVQTEEQTNVNCFGENTGSVSITSNGGNRPFTFNWSNGDTDTIASLLTEGNYSLIITDNNNCSITSNYTITQPQQLSLDTTDLQKISCRGSDNAAIEVIATGGTGVIAYEWNTNSLSNRIEPLGPGTYSVLTLDENQCRDSLSFSILNPDRLLVFISGVNNVACNGGNSGSASCSVIGGTPPYSYSWSNGSKTSTATNLNQGLYSVTVTDNNNCSAVANVSISEPIAVSIQLVDLQDISCLGANDGIAEITPIGGNSPYSYLWSNTETTPAVNLLSAGTYSVQVTDNNSCTASIDLEINEPPLLEAQLDQFTNPTCFNETNGTASVSITGGTAPYALLWGDGNLNSVRNDLVANNYNVQITDLNNCTDNINFSLTEPQPIQLSITKKNSSCGDNNGLIQIAPGGGTPAYVYEWSNGETNQSISNLGSGNYSVKVTDVNGCELTQAIAISDPVLNVNVINITPVSCSYGLDGSAEITINQGSPPYQMQWDNGSLTTSTNGLSKGNHWVSVLDSLKCSAVINFEIPGPEPLTVNSTITNVSCNGANDGSINLSPSGGVSPYIINWENGSSSTSISNLTPGIHKVSVTDNNLCIDTFVLFVDEPQVLTGSLFIKSPISCNGESDAILIPTISGGSLPYTYLWSNGETNAVLTNGSPGLQQLDITDASNCTIQLQINLIEPANILATIVSVSPVSCNGLADGVAQLSISGGITPYQVFWDGEEKTAFERDLTAGDYQVEILDSMACSTVITVSITQPEAIQASFNVINSTCGNNNGSITSTVIGGQAPYSYVWSNGSTLPIINNLSAGIYQLTIRDNLDCELTVSEAVSDPIPEAFISDSIDVECYGNATGSATVEIRGGIPPFTIGWDNGQTTATAINLPAGNHFAIVTDGQNCQSIAKATIDQPDSMYFDNIIKDVDCFGESNGNVSIQVLGGTPNYQYLWADGIISMTRDNLPIGIYPITIVDANDCLLSGEVVIEQPDSLLVYDKFDTICFGQQYLLEANIEGGNGNYTSFWNNGIGPGDFHVLSFGTKRTYEVNVVDAKGCKAGPAEVAIEVRNMRKEQLTLNAPGSICFGDSIQIQSSHDGILGPYTYSWIPSISTTLGTFIQSPSSNQLYVLKAINSCGQSITKQIEVDVHQVPILDSPETLDPGCTPHEMVFDAKSNLGNLYYRWDFGDGNSSSFSNPTHVYQQPGTYDVSLLVTTQEGCTVELDRPQFVMVYQTPLAYFNATPSETDIRTPTISLYNDSFNAQEYNWTFGDGNSSNEVSPEYTYTDTGKYEISLFAINEKTCIDSTSRWIYIKPWFELEMPNAFTPNPNTPNAGFYSDGLIDNDVFHPHTKGVDTYQLQIFNRWGELVFESTDLSIGWDGYYRGTLSPQGVYVWKMEIQWINDQSFKGVGDLTLIR